MFIRLFSKGQSGWVKIKTRLTLGEFPMNFQFQLPCWIAIIPRHKVVVTAVDGLPDTVKQNMGFGGYGINISTHFGDYDPPQFSFKRPLKALDDLADLASFCMDNAAKPVKAVDEEGALAAIGVTHVVIKSWPVNPDRDRPGVYHVTLNCYSELLPTIGPLELLTEENR